MISDTAKFIETLNSKFVLWEVESNWIHSALRPQIGLLWEPPVIMIIDKLVEWRLAGETEVLRENLPQCRFVRNKSHMFCSDANPARGGKPATNRLTYGKTYRNTFWKILTAWIK
jgi:hypothetical protein